MGELVFVGLGLGPGGVSQAGLEELKGCGKVFAETYTAPVEKGMLPELAKLIGKDIALLGRKDVEDGKLILMEASRGRCSILVPGDPMVATTHVDLRLRAVERGIVTKIIHAASIGTAAAGLLGLQSYKFGRTTTLPFWKPGYEPTSPYDVVEANRNEGLHTLVLLDIDAEGGAAMTATQGMAQLIALEAKLGRGVFKADTLACVVARAGHDDVLVKAGEITVLAREDFGRPPHCIVIPGKLHFMESGALVALAGAPKTILKD
ncbi:MAG: diphthine synthase [Methanobacteriota archaeon]